MLEGQPAPTSDNESHPAGPAACADLLVLLGLACAAPVAMVSVQDHSGHWETLVHGADDGPDLVDTTVFVDVVAAQGPLEVADLRRWYRDSVLVRPPAHLRWSYGAPLVGAGGATVGAVVVFDRGIRQVTKREQRAMAAASRHMSAVLGHVTLPPAGSPRERSRPASTEVRAVPTPDRPVAGVAPTMPVPAPTSLPDAPLLRSPEVAAIFNVTERTVINWASAGKVPCLRTIGGHLRFRRTDIEALLDRPT